MYVSDVQRAVELEENHRGSRKPLLLESIDTNLEDGALVQFTYKRRKNEKEIVKNYLSAISDSDGQEHRYSMEEVEGEEERSIVEEEGDSASVLN